MQLRDLGIEANCSIVMLGFRGNCSIVGCGDKRELLNCEIRELRLICLLLDPGIETNFSYV